MHKSIVAILQCFSHIVKFRRGDKLIGWEKFNRIAHRMIALAYINAIWIRFSLVGLVAFGIFPATTAMFAVSRKLIQDEETIQNIPYVLDFISY